MNLFYLAISSFLLGFASAWLAALLQLPLSHAMARASRVRVSSRFWFAWGMLPPVWGASVALFVVAFGVFSGMGWLDDHCPMHPGHPHLCLSHILESPPGGVPFWTLLGLAWLGAIRGCWRTTGLLVATRRWVAGATAAIAAGRQVFRVAGSIPFAFTAGLWSPRIYWTRRAMELLRGEERQIVLIHEGEHQRRRDPLRVLLLEWRRAWLPGGQQVLRQWERQAEIECDRACIRKGFDPSKVASTILKLQKAVAGRQRPNLSLAYARHDLSGLRLRIEALFEQPKRSLGMAPVCFLLFLTLTLLVSRVGQAHHLLETALGWLR